MTLIPRIAAIALCAAVALPPAALAADLQISNFRQGAYRDAGKGPVYYEEGATLTNGINAECQVGGTIELCHRHAFEFDYVAPEPGVELSCVTTTSHPSQTVSPGGVHKDLSSTSEWKFRLPERAGHYFRPQYSVGIYGSRYRKATKCSWNGKVVLEFSFTFVPEKTAALASGHRGG